MGTGSAERDAEEERRRRRRRLLVALNASPDLSRDAICRLARRTDAWGEGSGARPRELSRELGVSPGQLKAARRVRRSAARLARPELERAAGLGVAVLTLDDAAYPAELFDLELPPPVLYLRGRLPARPAVAIVGSRKADPYALEAATAFARELAHAGLAIVSGLALGVDGAAHRGALEADGGRTLAVQACGADRVHPWRHTRLADRIAATGAVLTEFPFDTPPYPSHFPIRNRIIAALAEGTLVVQAARRSGTLITARLALELGREVWAIPGSIYRQRAVGANELLRDGAAIVLEPRDVLESLPLGVRDRLPLHRDAPGGRSGGAPPEGLSGEVLAVLERHTSLSPDRVAAETGQPVAEVLAALAELELAGLARRYPGPIYRVVDTPSR